MTFNDTNNLTFCGFPTFCSLDAIEQCWEIPLERCQACRYSHAIGILATMIITGLLVVIGNTFVFVVTAGMQKQKQTKRDYCKMSLAVADAVKGIITLSLVCPNILYTVHSSVLKLHTRLDSSRGSIYATAWGVFTLFCLTSSIYHLLYMSIQRFMAIKCPFLYRRITIVQTKYHLVAVWIISVVAASILSWNNSEKHFTYNVFLFQYTFDVTASVVTYIQIIPMMIFYLLPCVVMVGLTITTTHMACFQLRKSRSLRGVKYNRKTALQEISMFKITFAMNIGFVIGVVPFIAVMGFIAAGRLNCSNFSKPLFVCFNISYLTGLINVLIYSVFDKNFRSNVKEFFYKMWRKQRRPLGAIRASDISRKISVNKITAI